jgi:O-antigen ligase
VLVGLAVATPWPFGSVHPVAVRIVSLTSLLAAAMGLLFGMRSSAGSVVAGVPRWPFLALMALGVFQLLPLPQAAATVLAPGSTVVWYPSEPAAAAVLGAGPRPLSLDPDATRRWLAFAGGLGALMFLASPALSRRRTAALACGVVAAGGAVLAIYAIVSRTAFGPLLYGRIPVPTLTPFGPFVSKNHFAGHAAMAALLTHGLATGLADRESRGSGALGWTAAPGAPRVLLAWAAALAMALSVLVSQSRGGAVSLGAGVLVFIGLRRWIRHRRGRPAAGRSMAAALVAGLVLLALAATLPEEARSRLAALPRAGGEASGSFRLETWRDAGRVASSSPLLGTGFGSFADAFPRMKTSHGELRVEHAENDYLESLAEGGILGFLLLGLALVLPVRRVIAGLAAQEDRALRALGTGALASVGVALVHSTVDFSLRIPANAALFAFIAAVACGAGASPGRSLSRGTLAAAFVACVAAAIVDVRVPRSRPAAPAEDLKAAAQIREPAARALRLERGDGRLRAHLQGRPADAEAWLLLGWARAVRGDPGGEGLARHARALDPQRPGLSLAIPAAPVPAAR